MNVIEIKSNLVKIAYEPKDDLALAGFVVIEDENCPYVAQIMNVRADDSGNYAVAKLLFTFNDEGILKSYNGTIPSIKSIVSKLPAQELLDVIPVDNPIIFGRLAQQNTVLRVDKSIFQNNLLICSDNVSNTCELIEKIFPQVREKVVIIDTDGYYHCDDKIVFSKDFKLPLNYQTIDYIYENDLDDVDAVSKAIIQDIFKEVQDYTRTLPDGFLPFDSFYNVVDDQCEQTNIPQLVLLKNKLLKYKEAGVFAQNHADILGLTVAVENKSPAVIDISNCNGALQKELINYIYSVLNNINSTVYSFVKVNNDNSDKKLLRLLTYNTNVFTTLICSHEYKYVSELKKIAQNLILFTPQTLQHDFLSYNSYLNKLNGSEFIVYGAHTQNIPLIAEFAEVSDYIQSESKPEGFEKFKNTSNETENTSVEVSASDEMVLNESDNIDVANPQENNLNTEVTENQNSLEEVSIPDEEIISEEISSEEILEDSVIDDETFEDEPSSQKLSNDDNFEMIDETPQEENKSFEGLTQPIENILSLDEEPQTIEESIEESIEEPVIVEDNEENGDDIETSDEDIVEQVAKDVDKVFYEKLPADDDFDEDVLTDDDLNLIDDLDNTAEDEPEEQTPVVPIYAADDIEEKEILTFEPGDRVSTPKYGEGVVENMVKYGDKMLCSIDFPNIGRRLLNPALTDIKKLS